jgi:signal transduction histidine kinase
MTTAAITSLSGASVTEVSLRERLGRAQAGATAGAAPELVAVLDRIEAALSQPGAPAETQERVAAARARALTIASSGDRELSVVSFLSDLFVASALEREWAPAEAAALFDSIAEAATVSRSFLRTSVCMRALRDPALLEVPASLAFDALLNLLLVLAPVTAASLWRLGDDGRSECLASAGAAARAPRVREAAVAALAARAPRAETRGSLRTLPVTCYQRPDAVLVLRARDGAAPHAAALAEEATTVLGFMLEREILLERNADRERSLVEASERRLTRLGFDLHDGPVQDVMALAAEVRFLREELVDRGEPSARRGDAGERFDRLEKHLLDVGRELRELSSTLEPTRALRSLRDGLEKQVETFRKHADIEATLDLNGDFDPMTASQRIAVLRIVQEALTNVREHSGATTVHVAASVAGGFVRVDIADDGNGFDVESALPRAAKSGRLGLVGMSERVRLLGGRMNIESRPGGPTRISAVLRVWQPHGAVPATEGTAAAVWAS